MLGVLVPVIVADTDWLAEEDTLDVDDSLPDWLAVSVCDLDDVIDGERVTVDVRVCVRLRLWV